MFYKLPCVSDYHPLFDAASDIVQIHYIIYTTDIVISFEKDHLSEPELHAAEQG